MNIYVYNSSTINEYLIEDLGLISSSIECLSDCGELKTEVSDCEDFYVLTCSETVFPFGSIKIKKETKSYHKKISKESIDLIKINDKSLLLSKFILFWIGFGTIFEFNNGLERQVIPDVSGGGVVK